PVAQPDIEQDARVMFDANLLKTLFARLRRLDFETLIPQHRAQRVADALFVVNDEDGVLHLSVCGQLDDELRTFRLVGDGLYAASVLGNYTMNDRQAEASAAAFCREVRLKELLQIARRDSAAGMRNLGDERSARCVVACRYGDVGWHAVVGRFERVLDQ